MSRLAANLGDATPPWCAMKPIALEDANASEISKEEWRPRASDQSGACVRFDSYEVGGVGQRRSPLDSE